MILASALALVIVLIVITMLLKKPAKKENFSFGDIFSKVKDAGKKVGNVAKDGFNAAKNVVAPNSYQPTYTQRINYKNSFIKINCWNRINILFTLSLALSNFCVLKNY